MKKVLSAIVLVAAIGVGYWFFAGKDNEKETAAPSFSRIRIAYNAQSVTNAGVIVALEKGYFQKNNLAAEMIPLKGGKEVMQAIVAGQADAGLGGFPNFMGAMEKGAPIRYIAASASSPTFVFVRSGDIRSISELAGKKVSVSVNGINDLIFRKAMSRENVDMSKMEITDVERSFMIPALMERKAVDAIVVSEQDTKPLLRAGAVVLPEWESKGYSLEYMPRNSLAINTDFLDQNEVAATDFVTAFIDAERFIAAEPAQAAGLIAKHIKEASGGAVDQDPRDIVEQWKNKEIENMVWQDPSVTMELAKQALEAGLVKKDLQLNDVFDLRFREKLESAQNEIFEGKN